jgi:hypothetical protein
MKKIIFALLTLGSMTGCMGTYVSGNGTNSSAATDDVWYVKNSYFLYIFQTGTDVYYCPPAAAAGQKTCKKAVMHDE